jgi:hypothetical protein
MESAYKVCPRCHSEFLPSVELCGDCGLPLVWEGEATEPHGDGGLVLSSREGLVLVREAELGWARGLAQALARAGIPHRLDPGPAGGPGVRWVVSVGAADAVRAQAVDADYARSELPDLEDSHPPEASASEDACPACGEPVGGDAAECPGCGLVFAPGR